MNSGIYKLVFTSGKYYIGKTNNFERRWEEHYEKMQKGTAAKAVQEEFNICGYPECAVVFECHADHIDLMEPYYIAGSRGPNMLNSVFPTTGNGLELDILNKNNALLKYSTASICDLLQKSTEKTNRLTIELQDLKTGTLVTKLEAEIDMLTESCVNYVYKIEKLKKRSFFDYLFNNY